MDLPPRGQHAIPDTVMQARAPQGSPSGVGTSATPGPDNRAEQEAAHAATVARLGEWYALVDKLLVTAPPVNATLSHTHLVSDGLVMAEGLHTMGEVADWRETRRGTRLRHRPDPADFIMGTRGLRNGTPCPLHGEPCVATVGHHLLQPRSVTFEVQGWQAGKYAAHLAKPPRLLTSSRTLILASQQPAISLSDRAAVAWALIPAVAPRHQQPSVFALAFEARLADLRTAMYDGAKPSVPEQRSGVGRWFTTR